MDAVSIPDKTELIWDFSIFTVSNSVGPSPSSRFANIANKLCQCSDIFNSNTISLEGTYPLYNPS